MKTRTLTALAAAAAATLACAAPTLAATPFSGPTTGSGWDLAVGGDGTGHAVWLTDEPGDRVQYCRVPAGGSACDGESALIPFPTGAAAEAGYDAQIFTPAPNTVVILASCYVCGAAPDATDRSWRWISTDNGASFGIPDQVGSLRLQGQAAYLNGFGLTTEGSLFQGADDGPSATELDLGSFPFVYSQAAAVVPGGSQIVHAVDNLDTVKYAVFTEPSPPISATDVNTLAKWQTGKFLPAAEGDNDETRLSSGPNGVYLSYANFVPNNDHVGLRRFDDATDTFGAPTYVEGANTIENHGIYYPHHSQDSAGRLHFVWRSNYDSMRLRYTRSDNGGATWTPVANLAVKESFFGPIVEAGPTGTGFAIWGFAAAGETTIRIVAIDPQLEADPAAVDNTPPTAGGLDAGDKTLLPGQGTTFTFNSSEAGKAVLSFQKRVKGLKVKKGAKLRCVPKTKKLVRKLRPKLRGCKAWKKIGKITKNVGAGPNKIVFSGRLAGRKLGPGKYRALLKITDKAGNVSSTETLRFRVLKRKRKG